jgi:DNA-binding response OmpR family regulator
MHFGAMENPDTIEYIGSVLRSVDALTEELSRLESDPDDAAAILNLERIAAGSRYAGGESFLPEISDIFSKMIDLLRNGPEIKSGLNTAERDQIKELSFELKGILDSQATSGKGVPIWINAEKRRDSKGILIIDHDQHCLEFMESVLTNDGYLVEVAEDVDSAMTRELPFLPDLILVDFSFPDLEGLTFIKKIKRLPCFSLNRIIGLSAMTNAVHAAAIAFESGADDFIGKPFQIDELVIRVKNQMNRKHQDEQIVMETEIQRNKNSESEKRLDSLQRQITLLLKEKETLHLRLRELEEENRVQMKKRSFSSMISWSLILLLSLALLGMFSGPGLSNLF